MVKTAKLSTKYPSRATIKRLSRAECEERLAAYGITLEPIKVRLPAWWDDVYEPWSIGAHDEKEYADWLANKVNNGPPSHDEIQWNATHQERRDAWTKAQATDGEHPHLREVLYLEGVKRAVAREDTAKLATFARLALMDASTARGCELRTTWWVRSSTRQQKEAAVIEYLSKEEPES